MFRDPALEAAFWASADVRCNLCAVPPLRLGSHIQQHRLPRHYWAHGAPARGCRADAAQQHVGSGVHRSSHAIGGPACCLTRPVLPPPHQNHLLPTHRPHCIIVLLLLLRALFRPDATAGQHVAVSCAHQRPRRRRRQRRRRVGDSRYGAKRAQRPVRLAEGAAPVHDGDVSMDQRVHVPSAGPSVVFPAARGAADASAARPRNADNRAGAVVRCSHLQGAFISAAFCRRALDRRRLGGGRRRG